MCAQIHPHPPVLLCILSECCYHSLLSSDITLGQPANAYLSQTTMKGTAIVASLCCIMAVGLAYPRPPAYLMTEEFEAQTQWHLSAPSQGCVEVSHSVGGATFRTYACDGANGE